MCSGACAGGGLISTSSSLSDDSNTSITSRFRLRGRDVSVIVEAVGGVGG